MRRTTREEITAAARRRLADLGGAPLRSEADPHRGIEAPTSGTPGTSIQTSGLGWTGDAPATVVVEPPGRHARDREPVNLRLGAWVEDRLPTWLRGRLRLTTAHLLALVLLAATSVAVTAWTVHRAAPVVAPLGAEAATRPTPVPQTAAGAPLLPAADRAVAVGETGEPGESAESGEPGDIVVDIAGKVRRPGVRSLPAGSRVGDAITAAGGPRRGVDLTPLNLARRLVDGEQVLVGVEPPMGIAAAAVGDPGASPGGGALVNLNSAGPVELETLPGVGPKTAQKILEHRQRVGAFTTVDELMEIPGIGEKTLARLAPHLTL